MMVTALTAAPIVALLLSHVRAGIIEPPQPITGTSTCGERCDRASCIEPGNCPAGTTWDRCLCCRICARREGDRCDLGSPYVKSKRNDQTRRTYAEAAMQYAAGYVHGTCGLHLECKIRTDLDEEFMEDQGEENGDQQMPRQPETTCVCTDLNPRCGSDNQTYPTLCSILEEQNMWTSTESTDKNRPATLDISHIGPCNSPPSILQPLENHIDIPQGTNVLFTCDVVGFPLPQINWHLHTVDGRTRTLPDGDGRISVSSRGASRPDRVTSWLQVIQVSREHEGDYSCTVENGMGGEIKSTGRLLVSKHFAKDGGGADAKRDDDDMPEVRRSSQARRPRMVDDDEEAAADDDEVPQLVLDETNSRAGEF